MKYDQCKSKLPSKSVNSVSVGSIRDVRKRNLKRIILGHLNINSIRNKFDLLVDQIKGNVDIMVISETKLDESFPNGQFKIPGLTAMTWKPFCKYVLRLWMNLHHKRKSIPEETICQL